MESWSPISDVEFAALLPLKVAALDAEKLALFNRSAVAPYRALLLRYGLDELAFVVARTSKGVIYYEDVEEGFNFSPEDGDGRVLEHWCEQYTLSHTIYHWGN